MVIYTTAADGPYADLATDVAAARGEAVVSTPREIRPTEPVRYVDRPDRLSPDLIYRLIANRVDAGTGAIDVALVTGRTPAEARALFERMQSASSSGQQEVSLDAGAQTGDRTTAPTAADTDETRQVTGTGHHVVVPDSERAVQFPGDTQVYTDDDATVAAVASIESAASLSAVLHGKNTYTRLSDGLIVGAPGDSSEFDFPPPQPPFVVGTEGDGSSSLLASSSVDGHCSQFTPTSETQTPTNGANEADGDGSPPASPQLAVEASTVCADGIDADQVFLDSCSTLIGGTNRGTDDPVHVALGLLSNAQSVIGTFRVTECIPFHGPLHHALIKAGYPPAERAYILNRAAATAGLESYPYVIAGDPWTRPTDTLPMTYDYDWTVDAGAGVGTLELTDVDTPVIDITVPAPGTQPAGSGTTPYFLRLREGTPANPLYYTAFRETDNIRVIIGAWGQVAASELQCTLHASRTPDELSFGADTRSDTTTGTPATRTAKLMSTSTASGDGSHPLHNIGEAVADAERRAWAGPIDGSARNHLNEARVELRTANGPLTAERTDPTAHRTTIDVLTRAAEALENARKSVIDEVIRDADRLSLQDEYRHWTSAKRGAVSHSACPYCQSTVHVAERTDEFTPVTRALGRCPNCAYVFDIPSDCPPTAIPELHGEFLGATGDQMPIEVRFQNPLARPVEAAVVVTVTDDEVPDADVLPTPVEYISLGEGERGTVEVPLDLAELRAAVSLDTARDVSIDADPSYFGPTFRDHYEAAVGAIEDRIAADPSVLDNESVPIVVDGNNYDVPTETFDAQITDRATDRQIRDLDGFYTIEAAIILRNLAVYSGIRTLYPVI